MLQTIRLVIDKRRAFRCPSIQPGCLRLFINPPAQKFAGLEERTGPARDFDRDASSWVPARARPAMPDREG